MNEELRSATEELETGREELQSINEELSTVNSELKSKVEELGSSNSDMQNLMDATAIATVFLDRDLHITRYTPPAVDVFKLIPADIGRPLTDLRTELDYPELARRRRPRAEAPGADRARGRARRHDLVLGAAAAVPHRRRPHRRRRADLRRHHRAAPQRDRAARRRGAAAPDRRERARLRDLLARPRPPLHDLELGRRAHPRLPRGRGARPERRPDLHRGGPRRRRAGARDPDRARDRPRRRRPLPPAQGRQPVLGQRRDDVDARRRRRGDRLRQDPARPDRGAPHAGGARAQPGPAAEGVAGERTRAPRGRAAEGASGGAVHRGAGADLHPARRRLPGRVRQRPHVPALGPQPGRGARPPAVRRGAFDARPGAEGPARPRDDDRRDVGRQGGLGAARSQRRRHARRCLPELHLRAAARRSAARSTACW